MKVQLKLFQPHQQVRMIVVATGQLWTDSVPGAAFGTIGATLVGRGFVQTGHTEFDPWPRTSTSWRRNLWCLKWILENHFCPFLDYLESVTVTASLPQMGFYCLMSASVEGQSWSWERGWVTFPLTPCWLAQRDQSWWDREKYRFPATLPSFFPEG